MDVIFLVKYYNKLLCVWALLGGTVWIFKSQAIDLDRYKFEYYFYTSLTLCGMKSLLNFHCFTYEIEVIFLNAPFLIPMLCHLMDPTPQNL